MDEPGRQITKIAREAAKLAALSLRADGVGTAELDFIHAVRHHPGITQAGVREALGIDKGAAARRAQNLESKGYLVRRDNPEDGRSRLLYATEKAERLKSSRTAVEAAFYGFLLATLSAEERAAFLHTLGALYERSKAESRAGFPNVSALLAGEEAERP